MSSEQPEGFLALPAAGRGKSVLVLHAWWGLNDTVRAFCTRLAEEGFVAFAPDLYRGQVTDTIEGAEALAGALFKNRERAVTDIAEAAAFLKERGDTGLTVIGFSLGASYALRLAASETEGLRKVVLFYGTGGGDFSTSQAAFLGHFAENDDFEPREEVDALEASLREASRPVAFYHYPNTGHWFFEPDRTDAYDETAAELAWERTLDFLRS